MKRKDDKDLDAQASDYNHKSYRDGCKFYNEGQFNKAKSAFAEAIDYWPEDAQAWFALGNCYDALSKPAKAEESFRQALTFTSDENKPEVFFNLGNSLLDQAKFEEAIECFLKVSAQSDTYRAAQINLERAKNGNASKNSS